MASLLFPASSGSFGSSPLCIIEADPWTPCRKLNKSPSTVEDQDVLKKPLTSPLVRKVDLHFPLGLEVTARNLKGVTIKDALDAIYKQFKKKVNLALVLLP